MGMGISASELAGKMAEDLAKVAARGGGNFAAGLKATMLEEAGKIDAAAQRIVDLDPHIDKTTARRAILKIMKKGSTACAAADAIITEWRRLAAQGLRFDADGIACVERRQA